MDWLDHRIRDRLKILRKILRSVGLFELVGSLVLHEDATNKSPGEVCDLPLYDADCEW